MQRSEQAAQPGVRERRASAVPRHVTQHAGPQEAPKQALSSKAKAPSAPTPGIDTAPLLLDSCLPLTHAFATEKTAGVGPFLIRHSEFIFYTRTVGFQVYMYF